MATSLPEAVTPDNVPDTEMKAEVPDSLLLVSVPVTPMVLEASEVDWLPLVPDVVVSTLVPESARLFVPEVVELVEFELEFPSVPVVLTAVVVVPDVAVPLVEVLVTVVEDVPELVLAPVSVMMVVLDTTV